jgi:hypothetical protein
MHNGAIHQGISNRSISGARGANSAIGRNRIENRGPNSVTRGERERRHGKDDGIGHDSSVNRGERERERRHGKDDGIGHDSSVNRGERERERRHGKDDGIGHDVRDDRGGHGERERGDDHGGGG